MSDDPKTDLSGKPGEQEMEQIVNDLANLFHDWKKFDMMPDEIEKMVTSLDDLFRKRRMSNMTPDEISKMVRVLDELFREKTRQGDLLEKS